MIIYDKRQRDRIYEQIGELEQKLSEIDLASDFDISRKEIGHTACPGCKKQADIYVTYKIGLHCKHCTADYHLDTRPDPDDPFGSTVIFWDLINDPDSDLPF